MSIPALSAYVYTIYIGFVSVISTSVVFSTQLIRVLGVFILIRACHLVLGYDQ